MNSRRKLVIALGAGVVAPPFATSAQQTSKVWRLGFIWPTTQAIGHTGTDVILRRLRDLGYVEGRDFIPEYRWANGNLNLLDGFAAELVDAKVDLIVTVGGPAIMAVKSQTRTIPVVFSMVSDPVAMGIVDSLARPGANLTGWSNMQTDLSGKLLELLRQMTPRMSHVSVLANPGNAGKAVEISSLQKVANTQGLNLQLHELRTASGVDAAFAQMSRDRVNGLIVLTDALTLSNRQRIVDLAQKNRLPAVYQVREFVDAGGLMSYGLNINQLQERTAEYVARIFKGARPADLPVEQPTKFELIINGKTAKALGLKIPQSLLISADKVIE